MSMNTTGTPREKGGGYGSINKLRLFFEHYNGILIHLITNCYLFLDCFYVGIMCIPLQKLIFNPLMQKLYKKRVDPGTKISKLIKLSPNHKIGPGKLSYFPSDVTPEDVISKMIGH